MAFTSPARSKVATSRSAILPSHRISIRAPCRSMTGLESRKRRFTHFMEHGSPTADRISRESSCAGPGALHKCDLVALRVESDPIHEGLDEKKTSSLDLLRHVNWVG